MTKDEALVAAGQTLEQQLRSYLNDGLSVLFLTSGGSALQILEHVSDTESYKNVTLSVLDERWGVENTNRNFSQFSQTSFFRSAVQNGAEVIDPMPIPGESIQATTDRFNKFLLEWKKKHPDGKILITQGIGPDGHTAGIMPFPDETELFQNLFVNTDAAVVCYDAGSKNQFPQRITVTIPFLKSVDQSIVFAFGSDKREALKRTFSSQGELAETPARIIREMNTTLFVEGDLVPVI